MRLFGLLFFLCVTHFIQAQCSCTDCPFTVPEQGMASTAVDIDGSTNDVLGSSGQSIQAICITLLHDAINEVDLILTAPDGSTVQLIESTGTSFDDNVYFDICFVACSETAEPDPGFSDIFDSSENWMFAGIYGGSYYPSVGCLEDLTGTINGEWTLDWSDGDATDGGMLLDWCLQFADDAGLDCGTSCYQASGCAADGGTIPDVGGTYCEGDPALNFDLTPIYTGDAPDPSSYSYTYTLENLLTGELEQLTENTDFTPFAPGEWEMCGLSYLTADFSLMPFPPPPGYTFSDLEDDIANGVFCADLSDNCVTIIIDPVPEPPQWFGPENACPGELLTYEILNYDTDLYTYEVSIVQGSFNQFVQNEGIIEVEWASGPGEICVTATNSCGSEQSCIQVAVGSDEMIAISGNTEVCVGNFETYTITPQLEDGQQYIVSVTNGSAFPVVGNSVQVNWDPGMTGELCVSITGPGCLPEEACIEVQISSFIPPLFVDNPLSMCVGQIGFASIPDDPEIIGLNWFGDGFTILSGQGTTEIEIQADDIGITETCVEIESSCGLDTVCTLLEIFDIPDPMITTAEPTPACGNDFFIYLVFSPGTDLLWSVIDGPAGGIELSGVNAAVVSVSVNEPGIYSIQIEESIGDCVGYDTITIDIPLGPSQLTVSTDCDLDGNYTVTIDIEGGTGPFTVNGDEITGDQFVSDPIPSGDDYSFGIVDANGCISMVSGNAVCPCLSSAGTMDGELIELCAADGDGYSADVPMDAILDNNDSGVFVLHSGSGASLGSVIETNTTGNFAFQSGMNYGQIYYVSYVVGNALGNGVDLQDPCVDVAVGQPVVFYDEPDVSLSSDNDWCQLSFTLTLDISSDVTVTTWEAVSGPGTVNITNALPGSANVTVSEPGIYQFEVISSNGVCSNSVTFEIEVNSPISIVNIDEECSTPDDYTLMFEVVGGVQPFTANIGGEFSGSVFTSESLITTSEYDITVTDAAGCSSNFTVGPVQCDCEIEAGMMSTELIELCEGDSILIIEFLGGGNITDGDIERFVIHGGAGGVIENLILETTDETITLPLSLLQAGVTYYVSHVVGDESGGGLDLNDPCLDVSPGQPFMINALPPFSISDSVETCPGTVGITIANAGNGGIVSVLNNSGGGQINLELNGNTISVGSSLPTVVEVEYFESSGSCIKRDTAVVTFLDNPQITNITEACFGTTYVVSFDISGNFGPFTVNGEQVSGPMFVSDTFNSGEQADFFVQDQRGCVASYSTAVDCQCDLDAGTLSGTIVDLCVGDTLDFSNLILSGSIVGIDDTLLIIVYDGTEGVIDSILTLQSSGLISYDSAYTPGTTYYVAALATTVVNNEPNLNDPCVSVSNGIPVIWQASNSATLIDSVSVCSGESVAITINGEGLFPFEVYMSSDGGREAKVTLTDSSGDLTVTALEGTEIWQIDSISGACTSIQGDQTVITGEVPEEPEFVSDATICNDPLFGSVLNLTDQLINDVVGEWGSPDFAIVNNAVDFSGVMSGTYEFVFTTMPEFCAMQSYELQVEVLDCDCPVITFPAGVGLCVDVSDYDLDDRFNIVVGGVWTLNNPNGLPDPPSVNGNLLDLTSSTPGSYELNFTIIDSIPSQCENEYSLSLNVIAEPNPGFQTIFPVLCEGLSQDLNLNTLLQDADPGGSWTFNGQPVSETINSGILSQGPNTFEYTVENTLCGERVSNVVVELGQPPEAGMGNDTIEYCEGEFIDIQLAELLSGADPGGIWTYEGQSVPGTINTGQLNSGLNQIAYQVGTAPCSDTAFVYVIIRPLPTFSLAVLNVSCFGENDGFVQVEPDDDGLGPYTVRINGIEQVQVLNASPGSYLVTVDDGAGCSSSELITISEPDALQLDLIAPDSVFEGEAALVTGSVNTNEIADAQWSYIGSIIDSSALQLNFIPSQSDSVALEIVDGNGCIISSQVFILVVPQPDTTVDTMDISTEVFIPNVFNPNSVNPNNRRFTIQFNEDVAEVNYFRVFDRWGALVYEVLDAPGGVPLEGWDGTYNGKVVNPGVFVYSTSYETVDGDVVLRSGDVTVVR